MLLSTLMWKKRGSKKAKYSLSNIVKDTVLYYYQDERDWEQS